VTTTPAADPSADSATSTREPFAERLLVLDGHSLAFRAFYGLPDSLKAPDGQSVQAVYGFVNMLFALLVDHRPRWVAATFDEGRPFRHELFDGYKAGREDIDPDVKAQVDRLRPLLDALDVWQVAGAPFEADDYIASLTARWRRERPEADVLVVSGDRDLFQCVGEGVRMLYPLKGIRQSKVFDTAAVVEKFGVPPAKLRDFKALVGDPSDNIPGVKGVGEKTAARLLTHHDTLEGVYASLEECTPALRRNLEAGFDAAHLSRELVTLREDAPVDAPAEALEMAFDRAVAEEAMRALGFETTIGRLPRAYMRAG
jgi:DNA polymerase-1